jgi:hypothetical protein
MDSRWTRFPLGCAEIAEVDGLSIVIASSRNWPCISRVIIQCQSFLSRAVFRHRKRRRVPALGTPISRLARHESPIGRLAFPGLAISRHWRENATEFSTVCRLGELRLAGGEIWRRPRKNVTARTRCGGSAPISKDFFLTDYRWPIAAGCIRRASCSIREGCGGAKGRTIPLPLETWSLIAARRFRIDCHCSQSSCRRNGRSP